MSNQEEPKKNRLKYKNQTYTNSGEKGDQFRDAFQATQTYFGPGLNQYMPGIMQPTLQYPPMPMYGAMNMDPLSYQDHQVNQNVNEQVYTVPSLKMSSRKREPPARTKPEDAPKPQKLDFSHTETHHQVELKGQEKPIEKSYSVVSKVEEKPKDAEEKIPHAQDRAKEKPQKSSNVDSRKQNRDIEDDWEEYGYDERELDFPDEYASSSRNREKDAGYGRDKKRKGDRDYRDYRNDDGYYDGGDDYGDDPYEDDYYDERDNRNYDDRDYGNRDYDDRDYDDRDYDDRGRDRYSKDRDNYKRKDAKAGGERDKDRRDYRDNKDYREPKDYKDKSYKESKKSYRDDEYSEFQPRDQKKMAGSTRDDYGRGDYGKKNDDYDNEWTRKGDKDKGNDRKGPGKDKKDYSSSSSYYQRVDQNDSISTASYQTSTKSYASKDRPEKGGKDFDDYRQKEYKEAKPKAESQYQDKRQEQSFQDRGDDRKNDNYKQKDKPFKDNYVSKQDNFKKDKRGNKDQGGQRSEFNKPSYNDEKNDANDGAPTYYDMEDYEPDLVKDMKVDYSSEVVALMVAEKPSIALSIAKALSNGKFTQRKGRSPICPVYQYRGNMMGHKNVLFKVTSVAGHVYSRDFPKQYANWDKTDPFDLFDAETVLVDANPKNRIIDHMKHEAKGASFLVLWLDNDREGENICFEIIKDVSSLMRQENYKQIYRAIFSSLAPTDLIDSFKKLCKGPNRNESISVDARQIIDLKIGVVFSRFQSIYFGEKYSKLSQNKITYGPCQTPTLGFCVQRHIEIEKFRPEKYFAVIAVVKIGSKEYSIPYTEEKRMSKSDADRAKKELEECKSGVVKSIENSEKKRGRPEGLNTVEMLKHASTYLGLGPHDTMHIAEKLYLSGYITYPRTESTQYADNFEFKQIVDQIKQSYSIQQVKNFASRLQIIKPKKGVDVGDHPPITPTTKIPGDHLSYAESNLYEYICRNFLASISSDAVMENTKVTLSHGQGKFELCLRGVVIKSAGFMEVANWVRNEDKMLDKFEKGAASVLTDVQIEERWTSPPDYLKESELITLMEKHGIGTDASMATHIQNICDRNYVTVVPGKRTLVPTPLGIALVKGYLDIDKELVEPQLRSKIEKSCGQIAKGEEKFDSVVDTMVTIFKEKFKNFKANVAKMDHYLKKDFTTMEEDKQHAKTWTTCGKCKRYMDLMTESCKIVCVTCDETFSLPKRHNFQKTPGLEYCALDNYQIFYYTFEDKTKSNIYYKICPRCYDSGIDDEEGQANQACITCEVKECPHSATSNYLMECKTCNYGQLTLMATSKAQYFAVCNNYKCSQGYKVGDNIKSVKLLEFDDKLKYHKLKIVFNKNHATRAEKPFEGMIFDDPEYKKEVVDLGTHIFTPNKPAKRERGGGRGGRGGKRF